LRRISQAEPSPNTKTANMPSERKASLTKATHSQSMRMNRVVKALLLFALLVCSAPEVVEVAVANPLLELGNVPPDAYTKPPPIEISSPTNNTIYNTTILTLDVNVSLPQSTTASGTILYSVSYTCDWQKNATLIYSNDGGYDVESQYPHPQYFNTSLLLSDVPDGNHTLTVNARAGGFYPGGPVAHSTGLNGFYRFDINGTSTVQFSTNTQPPKSNQPQTPNSPTSPTNEIAAAAVVITSLIVSGILAFLRTRKKVVI
jgi:hypothetical protein